MIRPFAASKHIVTLAGLWFPPEIGLGRGPMPVRRESVPVSGATGNQWSPGENPQWLGPVNQNDSASANA